MNAVYAICPVKGRKFAWATLRTLLLWFTLTLTAVSVVKAQNGIPPLGQWREHLNYQQTIQVVKGDKIYCATNSAVFSVDNNGELERYSKVTGLNDFGVQCIGWDDDTHQLVIAYKNSNLDVLRGSTVKNIGDIMRSTISGFKAINAIYCSKGVAYLSTGLGIIIVNLTKYEISDTWLIGNGGSQLNTYGFCSDGQFFYAATDDGLKKIAITNSNPANFSNWQLVPGLSGPITNVVLANGRIVVLKKDSVLVQNGSSWSSLYTDAALPINSITSSENKILICQSARNGNAKVSVLNTDGVIEKTVLIPGKNSIPRSALLDNGNVWIADGFGGLSKNGTDYFIPNGPPGTATGELLAANETIYAAAGGVNIAWGYDLNTNGVYFFKDGAWTFKNRSNTPLLDTVFDFITVAPDADGGIWAGSFGGGLVNFKRDGSMKLYKGNNSTLRDGPLDPGNYRVSGLALDQQNNLWISNYGAAQDLQVRKADGTFKAFTIPFAHAENAVSQILIDDYNQVWVVSPKGNGLFCFNYGSSIDNTQDDHWKFYQQGPGKGNLPSNNVLSILKEKNGFIWVGTDRGIGIILCAADVFSPGSCDATLPVIQQGNFAGLFFKDETVQCMANDGANRKWIGTKNGLWLVSEDGQQVIYRFTAENSPLLSNDVRKLTIDPKTGELFIATYNGICSFRSTATEGSSSNKNILIFPNPVPPGYNGTIAIRGLTENALVKITELSGRLVFQTRALGGQAIWNGRNYQGTKAASGVYLVIVRDDSGEEYAVGKVVVISGR